MSKADELLKLSELKKKGHLTDEEFNSQKEKVLKGENNKSSKLLEKFKLFMSTNYTEFTLVSSTSTTLGYQRKIPAQTPGCGTVCFLLLLGIIPGIVYYFLAKKDEEVQNINVTMTDKNLLITGWDSTKISQQFSNFNQ
jgi:hypothetical protein